MPVKGALRFHSYNVPPSKRGRNLWGGVKKSQDAIIKKFNFAQKIKLNV